VTLVNFGDNSLLGSEPTGINNFGVDEPDHNGEPLNINENPGNGKSYFNAAAFSGNGLGTPRTARRRFFYGPGTDNYDLALLKNVHLTEMKSLQFRIEASTSSTTRNSSAHNLSTETSTERPSATSSAQRRRGSYRSARNSSSRAPIQKQCFSGPHARVIRSVFCFPFLAMGVQWCGFEQTDSSPIVGDNLDAL